MVFITRLLTGGRLDYRCPSDEELHRESVYLLRRLALLEEEVTEPVPAMTPQE